MTTIALNLCLWRAAKGLSQVELARKAGIPRPNLSAIEKNRRDLTLSTLDKLARALEIAPEEIFHPPRIGGERLDRHTLDAVARAIVSGKRDLRPEHNALADEVALLLRNRLEAHGARGVRRLKRLRRPQLEDRLRCNARYGRDLVDQLLNRTEKYL